MALELSSSAFNSGEPIPTRYTCDGEDVSPPLGWRGVPEGAESLVLIVDDPDVPRGVFSHWVLFDVPVAQSGLEEGFSGAKSPKVGTQGRNDFGNTGYGGPCPPTGAEHRYYFRLYALDQEIGIISGATRAQVMDRIQDHIVAQTEMIGTYARSA
jgi:Raf kinase inhibitor-like YbhB/YbcL family protein